MEVAGAIAGCVVGAIGRRKVYDFGIVVVVDKRLWILISTSQSLLSNILIYMPEAGVSGVKPMRDTLAWPLVPVTVCPDHDLMDGSVAQMLANRCPATDGIGPSVVRRS